MGDLVNLRRARKDRDRRRREFALRLFDDAALGIPLRQELVDALDGLRVARDDGLCGLVEVRTRDDLALPSLLCGLWLTSSYYLP